MKFELSFKKNKLLDLVGNVEHRINFLKMKKQLEKLNIIAQDSLSLRAIVEYLRKLNSDNIGAWDYHAIKMEDKRNLDLIDIPVIKGANEKISLGPTRQQLCVFENCYNFEKGEVNYE